MCPEACDLGQLEGLADVLWASCIPPGPVGISLRAAVPPAGSRPAVSQEPSACCDCRALHHTAPGMRQAPTVPCCWPLLLATADKRFLHWSHWDVGRQDRSGLCSMAGGADSVLPWTGSQGTHTVTSHHGERSPYTLVKQIRAAALLLNLFRNIISIREQ